MSKTTIHETVTEKLGYRKLCARWVPKILTYDHKTKQMGSALKFLTHYAQEGDEFLDSIVTGDETWGFHHTPESKQQSLQWHHTHSPKTKKFKTSILASIFWDRKGILLVDFMPPDSTINATAYCDTLTGLQQAIQNKSCHVVCACSMIMRGPIPHTSPLRFWKNSSGIYWTICHTVWTLHPAIFTCFFTQRNILLGKSSTTMMRCKKNP